MAATSISPTATPATPTTTERKATTKQLWKTGLGFGAIAAGATSAVAGIASAADVSLEVGGQAIPVAAFAQVTFVAAIIGTILAVVLSHRARRPQRTFVVTTIALTLVSLIPDALADAATSTRLTLALTHIVAAAIVIPALAARLAAPPSN